MTRPGPWFPARLDSECDDCGSAIGEGDRIRADGEVDRGATVRFAFGPGSAG